MSFTQPLSRKHETNAESTKYSQLVVLNLQLAVKKYTTELNVSKTKWLPVEQLCKRNIRKMAHKTITEKHFPSYLTLEIKKHRRHLRNNIEHKKCGPIDTTRR